MAGFPLFFGFIGKEILYKGALTEDMFPAFATTAAVLSNAMMTAVAGIITLRTFMGPLRKTPLVPKEGPLAMWMGPVILGCMGIVFGIVPQWVAHWLIEPAVRAFHWTTEDIKLQLYHGINEPLLLSILTLGLGTTLYFVRRPFRQGLERVFGFLPVKAERFYTFALDAIAWLAKTQTRILQNGSLHRYLVVIIGSATIGIGLPFLKHLPLFGGFDNFVVGPSESLLVIIIAAAVILVVLAKSRLLAVCGLGVIGAGIAMLFLIFGAPDVALTQLLIETLTVIIVSLVLLRLPRLETDEEQELFREIAEFRHCLRDRCPDYRSRFGCESSRPGSIRDRFF